MESVIANSIGFSFLYSFSSKFLGKSKFSLFLFSTIFLIGNVIYFLQMKNPNLYQVLGIKRNFDRKSLYAIYKQKLKNNPMNEELIEKAYDTFNSPATTIYYDKFGETPGSMIASSIIYSPLSLYTKLLESIPIYLILLVIYTWRSRGEKLREARKIILAISVIILTFEINYVITESGESDFFDNYIELAIFENLQIEGGLGHGRCGPCRRRVALARSQTARVEGGSRVSKKVLWGDL